MKFTGERFVPNASTDTQLEIEHYQRYYSAADLVKDKVVIDAACGEGYGSEILSQHAKFVYGYDISDEAINYAKSKYKGNNLNFATASIDALPNDDNSVDVFISFETIEHVNEETQTKFLKEVSRVLRDDGIFIISTPDKRTYSDAPNYKNEYHIKEFYESEFVDFLSRCFRHVNVFYQRFEVTSIIGNSKGSELSIQKWNQRPKETGKYLIAVCSNKPVASLMMNSVVMDTENRYGTIMNRVITLQDEVEERSRHLGTLNELINSKDQLITDLQQQLQSRVNLEKGQLADTLDNYSTELKQVIETNLENGNEISTLIEKMDEVVLAKDEQISEKNTILIELTEGHQRLLDELGKNKKRHYQELQQKKIAIEDLEQQVEQRDLSVENLQRDIEVLTAAHEELINNLKEIKKQQEEKLQEKNSVIDELKQQIEQRAEYVETLKQDVDSLNVTINNQEGHINKLLQDERKLNNILQSDGWKLLTKYYRLRDYVLPNNSKRKLAAKLLVKTLKHPTQMLKSMNKENLQKFRFYFRTENAGLLENRVDDYLEKHSEVKPQPIDIYDITDANDKPKIVFPVSERPVVSIIIPVYNQWDYTYSCLKSIKENTQDVDYEVIIADDVSSDETINIKDYIENITVVRNKTNKGFLLNCNNAAKYAKGKYTHLLNNDTNVQKGWLASLVELIESDNKVGLVGSKLVYGDGKLQEAGGIIWRDGSGWNYGRLDDPEKPEYNYVKEVDYISGASIMVRSDLWNEIGGFDETYVPAYFEDADLAFEIRRKGYKVMYQPKSVVVHFEGQSHGTDINSGIKSYQAKNKEKFIEKWRSELERSHSNNGQNVFQARDRSSDKKTILFVDHYVPHFDKDAGGKCTYHYLKLFKQMGFNVVFIGDNFYKHEPYTTKLQQMGVQVLYGNWYAQNIEKWIKQNGNNIDYAYLNRPHISIKYIDKIRNHTDAKIIYFGHDLHYLRELRNHEFDKNDELLKSSKRWKQIEFELFNKADVIYVVGNYEQKVLQKEFPSKEIRNIPVYIYDDFKSISPRNFQDTKDILFVGGFNHKPNGDAVLWFVREVLPGIKIRLPNVKFYIVGSKPPEDIKQLQSEDIIVTGFVSDEELDELYKKCRVVVVPLRFGAGVKGKVVEALYYRVPIVTTSIGAEGLPSVENNLVIADNEQDFASSVVDLYFNEELWSKLAANSGEYIAEYFSKEAAYHITSKDFLG
ncbi:glycosyltransferase [Metallumcola ferriviriculae]|uniref:Glycosyltransferase n=1 Tax=Metallumcola ferriviriculae TaxID=3039180 RepID=A0AAU0UL21_9FIRM|nr:glycosyltransferase [Desulfitibacteraceae bacterium MK1]